MRKQQIIRMLVVIAAVTIILGTTPVLSQSGGVDVDPGPPHYVGDELTFRGTDYYWTYAPPSAGRAQWNFGDGSPYEYRNYGYTGIEHIFRNPGVYTVILTDTVGMVSPPETAIVTIQENRYITVSPANVTEGQPATFRAYNFQTPEDILWNFGDGSTQRQLSKPRLRGGAVVTHTFTRPGTYVVNAYDWNGDGKTIPVSISITIGQSNRQIDYLPRAPRADQQVIFNARQFTTGIIDWNFDDGTILTRQPVQVIHRFANPGTYTVSAKDSDVNHTPATAAVNVLPDIRRIEASSPEVMIKDVVTFRFFNGYGDYILWDFGDGSPPQSGTNQITHVYRRNGNFTVTAYDENGVSKVPHQTAITVRGISDDIIFQMAELTLGNGKYYQIVPKDSKNLLAVLKLKLKGTGAVSGYFLVDNRPFDYFTETAYMNQVKEIRTRDVPGLPTMDPGLHTVSVRITRPVVSQAFPVLRYYVLPYKNTVEIISPPNGFVAKEDEIASFTWKEARRGDRYQVAFSNDLYPFLYNTNDVNWIDVGTASSFTPDDTLWKGIKRNNWTYWKVRTLDNANQVVGESDIQDIKVVVATAEISINSVTDLEGNAVAMGNGAISSHEDFLLVKGTVEYKDDSKFLILRVYTEEGMADQLLFRNVKKGEKRQFETSVPNSKSRTRILFQVLKTSSPAVIIGIEELNLRK